MGCKFHDIVNFEMPPSARLMILEFGRCFLSYDALSPASMIFACISLLNPCSINKHGRLDLPRRVSLHPSQTAATRAAETADWPLMSRGEVTWEVGVHNLLRLLYFIFLTQSVPRVDMTLFI